ncbi:MAG TPA: aminotransferase class IV, partial [Pyrinomonadaceae bacterium]|nr:aminotransferase class IV [Pyrinomonadaceae bacterium]
DHVARLNQSAEYFGFIGARINADLERIAFDNPEGSHNVKVTLWKEVRIETQVVPIELLGELKGVQLAPEPVDSSDRFLYHKTTRRPGADGLVFWNERGEITESSIANVVVSIDGELFTPPIESGLLPGVFRKHLLAQGKIKERVITIDEFQKAQEFFLINSVRKWIRIIRGQ